MGLINDRRMIFVLLALAVVFTLASFLLNSVFVTFWKTAYSTGGTTLGGPFRLAALFLYYMAGALYVFWRRENRRT